MDQHVTGSPLLDPTDGAEKSLFSALYPFSIFFLLALVSSILSGCSRERPADPSASSQPSGALSPLSIIRSAAVVPDPVLRDSPIEVDVDVDEGRDEVLTYEYQWFINRVAVHGATTDAFDPPNLRRGNFLHPRRDHRHR